MLRKQKGFFLSVLGLLGLFVVVSVAISHGASVEVPVKVTLIGSCEINNNPEINFDDIDPLAPSENHTATDKLNFTCTAGTTYKIEFDNGKYYSDSNKRMKHESKDNYIVYGLTTPCTIGTATGAPEDCDITGTISKSTSISSNPVGKYDDHVNITITATN